MKNPLGPLLSRFRKSTPPVVAPNGTISLPVRTSPLSERVSRWGFLFGQFIQVKATPLLRRFDWDRVRQTATTLLFAFVFASATSTFTANLVMNLAAGQPTNGQIQVSGRSFANLTMRQSDSKPFEKSILGRNVFNSDGILPPEPTAAPGSVAKDMNLNFADIPCEWLNEANKLPVEIVGVLANGASSLVVMKDPKIDDSDVYKAGDAIIDHEEFEIFRISSDQLEMRKGNSKLCWDIAKTRRPDAKDVPGWGEGGTAAPAAGVIDNLDISWDTLRSQMGANLEKAMESAKLIPADNKDTHKIDGYQIIAIKPGTLFDTLKFQNNDVLVEVNGISLKDPTKGTEVYRILNEEREMTIRFTRDGVPMTRKVTVK